MGQQNTMHRVATSRLSRRAIASIPAVLVTLVLGASSTLSKLPCTGVPQNLDAWSTEELRRFGAQLCYSDLTALWRYRELWDHALPYVGSLTDDRQLTGGVIEYPALSGLFLWLTALPVSSDRGFILATGALLTLLAAAVTFILFVLVGRRAYFWAAAPALVLYVAYNVDVLPVFFATLGIALGVASRRRNVTLVALASVAFGIGGAAKLYPLLFVLPLALWYAWPGEDRGGASRFSPWRFVWPFLMSGVVVILINLPFVLFATDGWKASFAFQSLRELDNNTMAIWWWVPHLLGVDLVDKTKELTVIAAIATAAGLLAVTVAAIIRARREGEFPWIPLAGSMLAAFMVLNKVNSPQYLLWLLPFFALLTVKTLPVILYFVAGVAIMAGVFRTFVLVVDGASTDGPAALLAAGILARAALLFYFAAGFLRSDFAGRPSTAVRPSSANLITVEAR